MRVLLVGATGLVGAAILQKLLAADNIAGVAVLSRRKLDISHPKLNVQDIDFEEISSHTLQSTTAKKLEALGTCDVYISALGTTMKQAKSRDNFLRVDRDYVLAGAKVALKLGACRAIVISAVGASKLSPSFYARAKSAMEQLISDLDFDSVAILRPSLLLGKRTQNRQLEGLAGKIAPLVQFVWRGPLKKLAPVHADTVANCVLAQIFKQQNGVNVVYASDYQPSR